MFVFVISTLIKKKRKEKTDNDDFSRLSELTSVSIFLSPAAGIIFVSFCSIRKFITRQSAKEL